DPLPLDRVPGGGQEPRRRQPDRALVGADRDRRLDRALAKGLAAEKDGAVVVLQRAGDEFGLARGAAVDDRDDRQPARDIARRRRDMLRIALASLDDRDVAL